MQVDQHINDILEIPKIGFGTAAIGEWQQDSQLVTDATLAAIDAGYRYIDTASVYGNERGIGQAITQSGLPRETFFITSKVWQNEQGAVETPKALARSLERLGLDYLDLYLIHWPLPEKIKETWQALEGLVESGKVKYIGLSNFRQEDIEYLLTFAKILPICNQIEIHPYFTQEKLIAYCQNKGITVVSWSPLGTGEWSGVAFNEKPLADPIIKKIADQNNKTVGQIILRWHHQLGLVPLPKSQTTANINSNNQIWDFVLTDAEMQLISSLNKNKRFGKNPDTASVELQGVVVPE